MLCEHSTYQLCSAPGSRCSINKARKLNVGPPPPSGRGIRFKRPSGEMAAVSTRWLWVVRRRPAYDRNRSGASPSRWTSIATSPFGRSGGTGPSATRESSNVAPVFETVGRLRTAGVLDLDFQQGRAAAINDRNTSLASAVEDRNAQEGQSRGEGEQRNATFTQDRRCFTLVGDFFELFRFPKSRFLGLFARS